MSLSNPTAENKSVFFAPDRIACPCDTTEVIVQGARVKISSGKIVETAACTEAFCGVADFNNPDALGNTVTQGVILLAGNVVWFDAPASDTWTFKCVAYAYDAGGYHYPGAVTTSFSNSAVAVGVYVGANAYASGSGKRVPVKILPTDVI